MSPRVVLVGAPGAGKSSVGRQLADRLGVTFRDTDTDVERTAGKPITDIFVEDGEPAFRSLERAAITAALREHDGVLALGGGAVTNPETRAELAGHRVVFLDVGLADAAARVGLNRDRPLLLESPRAQLKKLMDARRPLYQEVASATVVTTGRGIEEVVQDVEDAMGHV
ncbi:shikimate kinase [Phytoactinopolyspora halotolerans]|uniref:Shikimate kinase n=1 Tax=Phytoactinopolyspora halotolerans TaxID=1981512 RepID=A0A6L9SIX3_9ACTN|nr:shikimate kinase [Phytoactinopolyspora halotolerans]NEE04030.1 shikimate kinase [Phytoactinopolyspora halotolerans]